MAHLSGVRRVADVRPDARILVVDDDPNVSGLVGTILGSSGFSVESAADAADAIRGSASGGPIWSCWT